jgi:hypothetical protein
MRARWSASCASAGAWARKRFSVGSIMAASRRGADLCYDEPRWRGKVTAREVG